MQRQTAILLGLSTGAKSLLLDESFDGLDLSKRILLKRLLRKYAQVRNAAVILSSHNLRELEDVADRIGMIEGHRLAFDETVEDLHAKNPGRSLEQIFLDEREVSDLDLERVFIW
jgi:ABC-2 type transport system ATP-binding protein